MLEKTHHNCSDCHIAKICMSSILETEALNKLDQIVSHQKKIKAGESVYMSGENVDALYSIKTGSFKLLINSIGGYEQIIALKMTAEFIGLESIGSDYYSSTAIALEDSVVCIIPLSKLENISELFPSLQKHLNKVLCWEIEDRNMMVTLLGHTGAEKKLGLFLNYLLKGAKRRNLSEQNLKLKMSREEIASYLGLSRETVTRMLSDYIKNGILKVSNKNIEILKPQLITNIVN